jgi:uncharacterized protein (TIGR02118 family)
MIKRISVGKKNPNMTKEEFKKYYLEKHCPLFLKLFSGYVLKYVVNFTTDEPGQENPFDYVTELYFKDLETRAKMRETDECKNILRPDEIRLGAISQGGWFAEFIKKDENDRKKKGVKRIVVGTRDPAKPMEEFKKYYLEKHAPLFLKTIAYVRKYVVSLALDIAFEGKKNPYDFVVSSYWDDIETDKEFLQSEEYKNIIKPDGVKLGVQTSLRAYCEENIMKDF